MNMGKKQARELETKYNCVIDRYSLMVSFDEEENDNWMSIYKVWNALRVIPDKPSKSPTEIIYSAWSFEDVQYRANKLGIKLSDDDVVSILETTNGYCYDEKISNWNVIDFFIDEHIILTRKQ